MDIINTNFAIMKKRSEINRVKQFQEFRYFYEMDYEERTEIIKNKLCNSPFSSETLEHIWFQMIDNIHRVLNRKTAGIVEGLEISFDGTVSEEAQTRFNDLLIDIDFKAKMRESLKRMEFFNVVIGQPVWRDDEPAIDLITGDECAVETKQDYNKLKAIKLARADEDGEIIYIYWSADEHYIQDANGNYTMKDLANGVNPYGKLQFVTLRKQEGLDFWGEPNWNLFLNQIASDAKLSDDDRAEFFQKWSILFGVNTGLDDGTLIDPGRLINVQQNNNDKPTPQLDYINANVNWANIRENKTDREKRLLLSEGLPDAGASTDRTAQSASAKIIDEMELREYRTLLRTKLLKYVYDMLDSLRMVYNYHSNDKLPENPFIVELEDLDVYETKEEMQTRRDWEKQHGLSDEIDWLMEDKGITEDEAKDFIKARKQRASELGLGQQNTNPVIDRLRRNNA